MKHLLLVAALQILSPITAMAQDVWRTPDGKAVPETPSRKAKNGFGVSLVITADPDWQAKWGTPSHETPNFTGADTVRTGGRLAILKGLMLRVQSGKGRQQGRVNIENAKRKLAHEGGA